MSYSHHYKKQKVKNLKRTKRIYQMPLFWVALFGLITTISFLYVILFYSKFQLQKIEVSGAQTLQSKDIESVIWMNADIKLFTGIFNLSSKSIFLIDKEKIIHPLLYTFPVIANVQLEKRFPQGIVVVIKERKSVGVFCASLNNCFSIDDNWIIFEPLENITGSTIIKKPENNKEVFVGEEVVQKSIIDAILKIQKNLRDNFQIDIQEALVSNPLIFKTSENWKIYFNPNESIDMQITKMNLLLRDEIKVDARKKLQYIYLQYKDRAYYR